MAFVRTGLVAALLLATLTGCGLPVPGTAGGTTSLPTAAALTENASLPPTEGPPRRNDDNGGGNQPQKPWVSVPTMPAGGSEFFPDEDPPPGVHCLQSGNLADVDIPPEVTLTITDIKIIQGARYFKPGGAGCSSPVCRPGFRWTEDDSNCYIPVTEQGNWGNDATHKILILLVGRVSCPPGQRAPCEEYRNKIAQRNTKTDIRDDIRSSRVTEPSTGPTSTSDKTPPTEDAPASATN
jgi:hypothetical protein